MNHYTRHVKPWAMAFMCSLILLADGATLWAAPIPLREYHLRIQESIGRAEENEGKIQPEEISRFQEMFPTELVVQDSTGNLYPVDIQDFLRWLENGKEREQGRDHLISYQKALFKQISWEASRSFQEKCSWAACRILLENVYHGKEFRNLVKKETPAWKEYLEGFWEGLGRWLEDHLHSLAGIQGKWIFYLIYGAGLVLGGILIIWIIRSFGPVSLSWKRPKTISPTKMEALPEKGWRAWREEANQKAKQGAFRQAIRFLFISVLIEGHQKGWWVYKPEATNREHLARVEAHSPRREALQKLIERYELAWYGLSQPGREDFLDCEKWTQRLEASA